ncbi:MAG TPA: MFS transporter [Candidatus Limnocylindria bacterium]|jgi:MFS family permease|nr:MFS transporter [Candidatus Limnocylindria bacterium]
MFLSVIALALVTGALAGGGLPRLADLHLRAIWVLAIAVALRLGAVLLGQQPIGQDIPVAWGFVAAYLLLFLFMGANWRVPGMQIAAVGIGLNTLAVFLNSGQMPIWAAAYSAAGFAPDAIANDPFHFLISSGTVADFVARGGIFGDVVPLPIPIIRDVVSIGDLLLALGIFWAIVYSMTRPEAPVRPGITFATRPGDPFPSAILATAAAAAAPPLTAPSIGGAATASVAIPAPRIAEEEEERPQSPYLALVRNRSFSLLWVGQLISFFGDRINQVALIVLIGQFGSALDLGIALGATAAPSVVLGPLAGALVDRWDRRRTMIVCDVLRAGLVLLVPLAISVTMWMVYVIAFAVASIGLLFRPAKTAVVPEIVAEDQLVTANSASSVNETLADLIGYPVAAIIVALLASLVGAAFVLDAGTYLVSALLIYGMTVPRQDLNTAPFSVRAIWSEMVEGWTFLTRHAELFSNTVISTIAQLAFGAEIVCSALYARDVLDQSFLPFPENYGWIMASLGLGSVVGGLVIGAFAARAPKGPMTIAGFILLGLSLVGAALVRHAYAAIGLFFMVGVANMLYLVPTITLFQERTPQRLFGRVVSSRQALTFGAMALSQGLAGFLAGILGSWQVLLLGGAVIAVAGVIGIFVPAMRNAR